ncbi:MAG: M20/M25/M40 family metallo-hydrolase [Chloroflexota bacterium]
MKRVEKPGSVTRASDALAEELRPRARDMLAFLEELVHIESHATQVSGVDRIAGLLSRALMNAGFEVERVRGQKIQPANVWLSELMLPGFDYGSLADVRIARKAGIGSGRALLLADLDTSYEPGSLARFPFRTEDARALGPGIADMKGGLVVLAFALMALEECQLAGPAMTTVVLSPDEQAGSLGSRSIIEAEARRADWCFCLECARDGGKLMGSRAHIGVARLDTYGREAHAGTAHSSGINAIDALARKIIGINALTNAGKAVYVTVGQVYGGRRRSVVPAHAYCTIDVRTQNAKAWEEVSESLQQIARAHDSSAAGTELRIYAHRPGVPWTRETDALIQTVEGAGRACALNVEVIASNAAGSSSFAGSRGVPTLDGMGPAGGDLMTEREYVEIASLVERAHLLALSMHLLAREPQFERPRPAPTLT